MATRGSNSIDLRQGSRQGFAAALLTTILTMVSFATAFATPPRSGPFCEFESCVGYPYTDIAAFFPRDYLWMFLATVLALTLVWLFACVHYSADKDRRSFSLTALGFVAIAAAILSVDYFIQLTVIQPSVLRGQTDGLEVLSQYNPHGVFIALEALGYSAMSLAFLFAAPVFRGPSLVERLLRWTFVAAFVLALASLAFLTARYGHDLEYRFEVAIISINWTALIVAGVLLCLYFGRGPARVHTEA